MTSGSYWLKNDRINEIYNFGFIENYQCLRTLNQFCCEYLIILIKSQKAYVLLDQTEGVDLSEPCISRRVAPRDHVSNAGL